MLLRTKLQDLWLQWDWNNPKTQQRTLILLLGVLAFSALFNFSLTPALEQRKQLRLQLKQLQTTSQNASSKTALLSDQDSTRLKLELQSFQQTIPEQWNNSALILQISNALNSSGMILKQELFIPEVIHDNYAEQNIRMELEGKYTNFLIFLTQIEALPLLLNIQELHIQNPNPVQQSPSLKVHLSLSTYRQINS